MSKKKRKKFRVRQQACSIYDPQRTFRIDKSIQPERLFHEEGSDRWYTRNEMQAIGEANKRPATLDVNTLERFGRMRSFAFRGLSGKQLGNPTTVKGTEMRKCLECEGEFIPRRKRQKFCCDAHRTAFWKRRNHQAEIIVSADASAA